MAVSCLCSWNARAFSWRTWQGLFINHFLSFFRRAFLFAYLCVKVSIWPKYCLRWSICIRKASSIAIWSPKTFYWTRWATSSWPILVCAKSRFLRAPRRTPSVAQSNTWRLRVSFHCWIHNINLIYASFYFKVLLRHGHDKSVDWWSFGALMFDMLTGSVKINVFMLDLNDSANFVNAWVASIHCRES